MSRATLARHICLLPSQARPRGPELDGAIREGFFGNIDIDACMRSCEEDLLLCALEKTQGSINIQRIPLSYPDIALKLVEGIRLGRIDENAHFVFGMAQKLGYVIM